MDLTIVGLTQHFRNGRGLHLRKNEETFEALTQHYYNGDDKRVLSIDSRRASWGTL
jgi:hypothetical protein